MLSEPRARVWADRGCVTTMHPICFRRNSFDDGPAAQAPGYFFIFGFWTLFSKSMSGAVSWHSCWRWSYLESTRVGYLTGLLRKPTEIISLCFRRNHRCCCDALCTLKPAPPLDTYEGRLEMVPKYKPE